MCGLVIEAYALSSITPTACGDSAPTDSRRPTPTEGGLACAESLNSTLVQREVERTLVRTFTLIYCQSGKYPDVVAAAKKIPSVVSTFSVHGRCDAIIVAKHEKYEDIGKFALQLNAIPGVSAHETLVGFG